MGAVSEPVGMLDFVTEAQPVATASEFTAPNRPLRVVVLASGTGTLLQSILDTMDVSKAQIVAVGSDKNCQAIERAQHGGIPTFQVPFDDAAKRDRESWNQRLLEAVVKHEPDLVVSAGFMRILGASFIEAFKDRIINTHPALLPSFAGAHAVPDALAYGVKVTGTTVHIVDSGVDTGPILAQESVPVAEDDTVDSLHERIKVVERRLLVDVLHTISDRGYRREGRKAFFQ